MDVTTKIIFLVLGFTIDVAISLPTITPTDSEYNLATGDNFTLTCRSDSPVTWTLPILKITNNTYVQEHSINNYEKDGLYVSELHIIHANDLAVGFYHCNETNNPKTYSSIYLYVEDDDKLYYGREDLIVATGKQYSPLVIPCRPTSPNVEVKLYYGIGDEQPNEDESPVRLDVIHTDGSRWSYNSMKGFILSYVSKELQFVELNKKMKDGSKWSYDITKGFILSYVPVQLQTTYSCYFFKGKTQKSVTIIARVLNNRTAIPGSGQDDLE